MLASLTFPGPGLGTLGLCEQWPRSCDVSGFPASVQIPSVPSQRIEYMLAEEVSSAPQGGGPLVPGGPPSPDYTRQVPLMLTTTSPQSG